VGRCVRFASETFLLLGKLADLLFLVPIMWPQQAASLIYKVHCAQLMPISISFCLMLMPLPWTLPWIRLVLQSMLIAVYRTIVAELLSRFSSLFGILEDH
jgi:hypothetical protein